MASTDKLESNSNIATWWKKVLIGSLKFPPWSPVNESLSFQQVIKILQANPVQYLLVLKTLSPLEVVGVIFTETLEKIKQSSSKLEELLNLPILEVEGLVQKDFTMLTIQDNAIGDVEDSLKKAKAVVLYRTTWELKSHEDEGSRSEEEVSMAEKMHPVAVVAVKDVQSWIASVEEHHNIT